MSDAMDKLFQTRKKRLDKLEIDVELLRLAAACAPACAEALFDQIQKDLERFELEAIPLAEKKREIGLLLFGCRNGAEFSLRMDVNRDALPLIHCKQSIQRNKEASLEPRHFDIHIVADGQGYCSYRLNGKEDGRENTSAALIAPLFDLF
jgi:hypothetical protein